MLRLIPTAMHTLEDVEYTINTFKKVQSKVRIGGFILNDETDGLNNAFNGIEKN